MNAEFKVGQKWLRSGRAGPLTILSDEGGMLRVRYSSNVVAYVERELLRKHYALVEGSARRWVEREADNG